MNILEGKGIAVAFLGIKAHRKPLDSSDIIHSTFLLKISQRNMPVLFVDLNRSDGGGHLLNQCKPLLPVFFIGPVYKLF